MGAKNKAPDPKPEMTIPLAMPLLSGNHSIKASVLKNMHFICLCQIPDFVNTIFSMKLYLELGACKSFHIQFQRVLN